MKHNTGKFSINVDLGSTEEQNLDGNIEYGSEPIELNLGEKYIIGVAESLNEHNWIFYNYETNKNLYKVKRAYISMKPQISVTDVGHRPKKEVAIIREKFKPIVKLRLKDYRDKYQIEVGGKVLGTIEAKMKSLLKTEYTFDYNGWTMIGKPGKKTQIKSGDRVIANILDSTFLKDVRIEYYDKRDELLIVLMWMTWELAVATVFE